MIKAGFVGVIGRTNVGKSSLVNSIIGRKVSIVTSKVQTTRDRICGIYNDNLSQIVFIDTPGIHTHKSGNKLGTFMNTTAMKATKDVEVILLLAPANERIGDNDKFLVQKLKDSQIPVILVITKSDTIGKEEMFAKIMDWNSQGINFLDIVPTSSKRGMNIKKLVEIIQGLLPETGYRYFDEDAVSDKGNSFLIKEMIREKILLRTGEEIPHSTAIMIEKYKDKKNIVEISAIVLVERESQKPIIIGKGGSKLKQIATDARIELEVEFGKKVFIEIFVKVANDWRKSIDYIRRLGYSDHE
ncbi:GTP-binding protein Era [Spiroplasma sp. TIUS-1]|uniref:GTPase Era n=1 Tax=Spiroplasma sp. TIUS-1 TaxID=216963 RepID=UPI0013971341|nr:GTPase Era [Spiroplasma sp. TIUS-1]QHX35972.1 GTP-binding protein Era [Spiroplasma sp. TIUS-1]